MLVSIISVEQTLPIAFEMQSGTFSPLGLKSYNSNGSGTLLTMLILSEVSIPFWTNGWIALLIAAPTSSMSSFLIIFVSENLRPLSNLIISLVFSLNCLSSTMTFMVAGLFAA